MQRKAMCKVRQVRARPIHVLRRSAQSSSASYPILEVQQFVGNHAAQRLIASSVIQAKLQVSSPEDESEQQADRVADDVMRMPQPDDQDELVAPKSKSGVPVAVREDDEEEGKVQRKCDECEDEMLPVANSEGDEESIQKSPTSGAKTPHSPINDSAARSIGVLSQGGSPLPEATRSFFEPRFGANLSQVRVHTDSRAAETARSINAKAFTVGRNIAFGPGYYAPHSHDCRTLLAHELTHVFQQSQGQPRRKDWLRPADPTNVMPIHSGLIQRDGNKTAQAKRAKVEAAMQSLKTKYGLADVSEEESTTWTEAELKTVDKAFAKMTTEEQARLKGIFLIRTGKMTVTRKGKEIKVVGKSTAGWIRLTKGAFSDSMVTLHEAGHVIQHKGPIEAEEKARKLQSFKDLEAAQKKLNDAAPKTLSVSGTREQTDFASAMARLKIATDDFMSSDSTNRQSKLNGLEAAEVDADVARMPVEQTSSDPVSKKLLDLNDLQRIFVLNLKSWMDERTKLVTAREDLTEFVDIVKKNRLAKKSFKPFTDYVSKFWPDEPGEFFAQSYATWRTNPDYMKKNAKALFDFFEKKGPLVQ